MLLIRFPRVWQGFGMVWEGLVRFCMLLVRFGRVWQGFGMVW
jgi:hypothetical protein